MTTTQVLTGWVGRSQCSCLLTATHGEEGKWFCGKLAELAKVIDGMPRLYAQDGKGDAAVVSLHYFTAGADWWILERDDDERELFGYVDLGLGAGCAELGYINMGEMLAAGAELDLHWPEGTTLGEVKNGKAA